jgi:hypothetical protein
MLPMANWLLRCNRPCIALLSLGIACSSGAILPRPALGGNEEQLSLSHPEFRDAIATLSAALQNRSKDEIRGEEVRQHRKTMRLARAAVITLTALTLLAAGPTLDKMMNTPKREENGTLAAGNTDGGMTATASTSPPARLNGLIEATKG